MRELFIGTRRIADDAPTWIIAEVGHNHQGSVEQAKRLLAMCARAGVDAVKFQKRDVRNLYTDFCLNQPYVNENSYGVTYGAHREALEFSEAQLQECLRHAAALGLIGFATAFDEASADCLMRLNVPAIKIASGDLRNTRLLRYCAGLDVPLIVSTGGADWSDVDRAVEVLHTYTPRLNRFALLHCTAAYPVHDFSELNLLAIVEMRARYPDIVIGWSGHDSGIAMAVSAYTLGARILEKHVTLNRALKGTDHAFSLEEQGLRKLVRDVRRAELARGDGIKRRYPSETEPLRKMEKSPVAARDLPAAHVLAAEDIALKSPANGRPAWHAERLVGQTRPWPLRRDERL